MNYKSKLNIYYWLRKIYTSKIFQLLPLNQDKIGKKIFTSIYKSNHWYHDHKFLPNESVSVSGPGSNINTEQFFSLVKTFTQIIKDYNVKSLLDMPCGDFLWIHEIIKERNIDYLGIDIVEELIEENKNRYKNKNFNFENHNILNFSTNKEFDLILIRDLFIHIKNSDISQIIQNIKKINFRYIVLNSYNNKVNKDVIVGQHRKVNLLIEPFNLKKPTYSFKDHEDDKFFFIYDKKNLI